MKNHSTTKKIKAPSMMGKKKPMRPLCKMKKSKKRTAMRDN